jgi:hypothetical protein
MPEHFLEMEHRPTFPEIVHRDRNRAVVHPVHPSDFLLHIVLHYSTQTRPIATSWGLVDRAKS